MGYDLAQTPYSATEHHHDVVARNKNIRTDIHDLTGRYPRQHHPGTHRQLVILSTAGRTRCKNSNEAAFGVSSDDPPETS